MMKSKTIHLAKFIWRCKPDHPGCHSDILSSCAPAPNERNEQMIAFTNVDLIPMTSKTVIEKQTVLVRGSKIVERIGETVQGG